MHQLSQLAASRLHAKTSSLTHFVPRPPLVLPRGRRRHPRIYLSSHDGAARLYVDEATSVLSSIEITDNEEFKRLNPTEIDK